MKLNAQFKSHYIQAPPPKKNNKQTNKTNTTTTKNRRARVSGIARQANTVEYTIKDSQLVTCVTVMASLGLEYVEQNLKKNEQKRSCPAHAWWMGARARGGWVHVCACRGGEGSAAKGWVGERENETNPGSASAKPASGGLSSAVCRCS